MNIKEILLLDFWVYPPFSHERSHWSFCFLIQKILYWLEYTSWTFCNFTSTWNWVEWPLLWSNNSKSPKNPWTKLLAKREFLLPYNSVVKLEAKKSRAQGMTHQNKCNQSLMKLLHQQYCTSSAVPVLSHGHLILMWSLFFRYSFTYKTNNLTMCSEF